MKSLKILLLIYLLSGIFFLNNSAKAQPATITDLNCVFSGMTEAVWLTWTPPAGTVRYEVRYALSGISATDFNFANQFYQSWSGASNQGLVDYLTENKTWFFAMKAVDATGTASAISNVAWCFVPIKPAQKDTIAPTSSITDPKEGTAILAGKDYIIKGVSSDTGGSSVQKVEISLDNGKTWFSTKPKESLGTGFTFEYLWENPVIGIYHLKTRATDWWGNLETPGAGIKATVAAELPSEKPPVEKPISEMAVEELGAKIVEIQQKIIQILTQLIQLIQSQIT